MCGGKSSRMKILGVKEKPLLRVGEKRLIDYALDALWFCEVYGVTTSRTPKTERYLRSQGIECVRTRGAGYVEDFREAIYRLGLFEPLMLVSADLLIFDENSLLEVVEFYHRTDLPALKVVDSYGNPVGINIVDGYFFDVPQEEADYVLEDKVININTPKDLLRAIWLIRTRRKDEGWLRD